MYADPSVSPGPVCGSLMSKIPFKTALRYDCLPAVSMGVPMQHGPTMGETAGITARIVSIAHLLWNMPASLLNATDDVIQATHPLKTPTQHTHPSSLLCQGRCLHNPSASSVIAWRKSLWDSSKLNKQDCCEPPAEPDRMMGTICNSSYSKIWWKFSWAHEVSLSSQD